MDWICIVIVLLVLIIIGAFGMMLIETDREDCDGFRK